MPTELELAKHGFADRIPQREGKDWGLEVGEETSEIRATEIAKREREREVHGIGE